MLQVRQKMPLQGTILQNLRSLQGLSVPSRLSPYLQQYLEMAYYPRYKYLMLLFLSLNNLFGCFIDLVIANTGNSGSPCHWEDGKRPYYVLYSNFFYFLLCSSFWILGVWKQIQLKHFKESATRQWTFFGPNMGSCTCNHLCSSSALCHWPGKLPHTSL